MLLQVTPKSLAEAACVQEGQEGLMGLLALNAPEPEALAIPMHQDHGTLADVLALDPVGLARTTETLVELLVCPFALSAGLAGTDAHIKYNPNVRA